MGLVVYVRNDPVNLVDPDGRSPHSQRCIQWRHWDDSSESIIYDDMTCVDDLADESSDGGSGGQPFFKLDPKKKETLGNIADSEGCSKFLNALIKELGSKLKGKDGKAFDVARLLENIGNADIQNIDLPVGRYEHVEGNLIQMDPDAYKPHPFNWGSGNYSSQPGDEYTVYLHAGFHLAMSSSDGKMLLDRDLLTAINNSGYGIRIGVQDSMANALVGFAFARNCGPNAVSRPPKSGPD